MSTDNGANLVQKTAKKAGFFVTTLPLFIMAHFGHHLMTALPGILLPFLRDDHTLTANGMTNSQVSLVTMSFSLAYGLGQLPGGWLANRLGRLPMIAVGIFGVALVGILIGFSSSLFMLVALLILMGIVGGGYHPAATPWISASAGEGNQGRAIGYHFVGGGAGYFVAPFVGAAIAAAWGWRMSFFILAIPCAVFGIIFFFILKRRGEKSQLKAVADPHHAGAVASKDRWRPLIVLMILSFVTGSLGTVMTFFSVYLVDDFQYSKDTAVFVMALSSFAGFWAGPIGGWLSDRVGRLPIIIITSIISGVILFSIRWVQPGIGLYALLLFSGINMYMSAPTAEAYIMSLTSARNRSFIYGIYYMVGTGSTIFAPVMGWLTDTLKYQQSFMICGAASMAVSIVCGFLLWRTRSKPSQLAEASNS